MILDSIKNYLFADKKDDSSSLLEVEDDYVPEDEENYDRDYIN